MRAEYRDITNLSPRGRKEKLAQLVSVGIEKRAAEIEISYEEDEFPNVTRAQELLRAEVSRQVWRIEREKGVDHGTIRYHTHRVNGVPRTVCAVIDWRGVDEL